MNKLEDWDELLEILISLSPFITVAILMRLF
mgnify:CR=1 FL=1